ncbi:MAG TPA: gephyrin-like molybdotransferase Glp [Acidimicrobiia bacterium]
MRLLEDAQAEILGSIRRLGADTVELEDALGRVVSEDIAAREAIPPFQNSAMDGYAVRAADVAAVGALLNVIGEIAAGRIADKEVTSGTAMKIMTGAPMPAGADTVVKVEDAERVNDVVKISIAAERGTSVRLAGSDIPAGATVLRKGTRILNTHLGVLASIGAVRPPVSRRPRVALFSTGDELTSSGAAVLRPGQIRDSNRVLLKSMLEEVSVILDQGILKDDPVQLHAGFARAAAGSDVIVTSGGVSMGDHDFVRKILGDMGEIDFWKVAIKPAKPFAFGTLGGIPFFGLPGNPVSAAIAYEQLVRPALLAMQGATKVFRPRIRAAAGSKIVSDPDRLEFVRVSLSVDDRGRTVAAPSGGQGSHMLNALANADAFGLVPVGTSEVKAGQGFDVELFRNPETRSWIDV